MPNLNFNQYNKPTKKRIKSLIQGLDYAKDYKEWQEIALSLDKLTGLEEWKYKNASSLYGYEFIAGRLNRLRTLRQQGRYQDLAEYIQEDLNYDVGNISHPLLYAHTFTGTKKLIEDYVYTVCSSLRFFASDECTLWTLQEKIDFFRACETAYGQPVLMLSGGATLGLFHTGVAKALYEHDLLPKVFSGSSAGAIMAGMLATRTDQEIVDMMDGDGFFDHAFKFRSLFKILKEKGGIADIGQLRAFLQTNLGDYTFQEAFERSGRHVSISVSPYLSIAHPRIMNEITAPNLLIWSATLASCAVPLLFPAVRLTTKLANGEHGKYMEGTRWVDGSVRSDFPFEKMSRLYNINYSIASQVNPHIVPFMQTDAQRFSQRMAGWSSRLIRNEIKNLTLDSMDLLRHRLKYVPWAQRLLDHGYGIVGQRYYGDINLIGKAGIAHYSYMLRNPVPNLFKKLQREGEQATWAKLSHIEVQARIGKTIEQCLHGLKQQGKTERATDRIQSAG